LTSIAIGKEIAAQNDDQKSREVTTMTLRSLFEKEIFIRLEDTDSTLVCTTKWPLLSRIRRFGIAESADFTTETAEHGSIAQPELELPMARAALRENAGLDKRQSGAEGAGAL
jgi:hypothetical protein